MLMEADLVIGHNIIDFDLLALALVYPWFKLKKSCVIRDTLVLTRLMWPHIKDRDFELAKKGRLPKKLIGSHSLEAWGYRLGKYKGDYKGPWDKWSQEMQEYMDQDVRVTTTLWERCCREAEIWGVPIDDPCPPPRKDCVELEHRVAIIVQKVQAHGFAFNEAKAIKLVAKLTARKLDIEDELQRAFPPKTVETVFIPKANNKSRGYVKGVPFTKRKVVPFAPSSRKQVAERLQELGWKPKEFGKDGTPKVDDEVLSALKYPEAKLLAEYFMLEKRLGQIANGNKAWLRVVKAGRIFGRIQSGGAHTGRMTHSDPNLAQVPGNAAPYGEDCRSCFEADSGFVLVGADASGLELRDLAGYMAAYDGGEYINVVLRSDLEEEKAAGRDMHSMNAVIIGCSRKVAKVFFYAMIYGSGDANLGVVLGKSTAAGRAARERLMKGVPALGKLVEAIYKRVEKRGYLVGLDGRRLVARAKNAATNTLLQSAGAVQMKRALVILYDRLLEKGWEWGVHFVIVGLIHDEWQTNVLAELADEYGQTAVQAIRDAGLYYSFACPLDGAYKKGASWAETH